MKDNQMHGIEINNIVKKYGEFEAISAMNFTIPDGSFCVFLGPSGCGKSTTLNCVAGLEDVTSGQIKIGGVDVTNLPPHQRNIAMVFQSSLLYPHLTARQNILMSLKNTDTPKPEIERRFKHAVEILEIETILDKRPSNMSGGQRQRVAMAKAIVREPAAFLMDEPLAALDAALRQSLRADLVALQKRLGTTTIFVTHDQVEAMTMGDMIVVMNKGAVEQVGTPREIYDAPATKFVAGFIGSPPMNFFEGKIEGTASKPMLNNADLNIELPKHLLERVKKPDHNYALGIRPQHIEANTKAGKTSVEANVFGIENLGKEAILITKTKAGAMVRVLVSPDHSFKLNDIVHLELDLTRSFLFEDQ